MTRTYRRAMEGELAVGGLYCYRVGEDYSHTAKLRPRGPLGQCMAEITLTDGRRYTDAIDRCNLYIQTA